MTGRVGESPPALKVPAAIAGAFRAEGTDRVFAVMGDGNLDWLAEMATVPGVVIDMRHELAAVAAADGYARLSGRVGVASVTGGPGLTHAATSIRAAVLNETPMVILSAMFTNEEHVHYLDQRAFVSSLGARSEFVREPDSCLDDVRRSFYLARTLRVPIVLGVPTEFRNARCAAVAPYFPATSVGPRPVPIPPTAESVDSTLRALRSAQRPLILVGRGADQTNAQRRLLDLAERAGALTAATLPAAGVMAGDPYDLGVAGYFATPDSRGILASADLVLALGTRLDRHVTNSGSLYANATLILIDDRPIPDYRAAVQAHEYVRADAMLLVDALAHELPRGSDRKWRTAETAKRIEAAHQHPPRESAITDGRLDPRAIVTAIDSGFPSERLVVLGAGHFFGFAIAHMAPPRYPRLDTYAFAPVGQGLPTAIGAAAGDRSGRPVLLLEGDSGFLMNIQELDTLARTRLPVLVVVMNNAVLGSEYHNLPKHGYDKNLAHFPDVDFAGIARGFGIAAERVAAGVDEILPLLERFSSLREPMLIDARISKDVLNENWGSVAPAPIVRGTPLAESH